MKVRAPGFGEVSAGRDAVAVGGLPGVAGRSTSVLHEWLWQFRHSRGLMRRLGRSTVVDVLQPWPIMEGVYPRRFIKVGRCCPRWALVAE